MSEDFFPKTSAESSITVRFPHNDGAISSKLPRFAVGYWGIRGLAAPLRMMISASKTDYNIYNYDIVEDSDDAWNPYSEFEPKTAYFADKNAFIEKYSPFVNLPFVVDREKKLLITQTNACFAYLGRELGMWGTSDVEISKCEELLCEIYDLRNVMIMFAYGGDSSKSRAVMTAEDSMKHFKKIEKYLSSKPPGCHFLVGEKMTAPDFHLFEMLDQYNGLFQFHELGDFFKDLPNLKVYKTGFEQLGENQFYLKSMLHNDLPFNNCMANFASSPGPATYKKGQDAPWKKRGEVVLMNSL